MSTAIEGTREHDTAAGPQPDRLFAYVNGHLLGTATAVHVQADMWGHRCDITLTPLPDSAAHIDLWTKVGEEVELKICAAASGRVLAGEAKVESVHWPSDVAGESNVKVVLVWAQSVAWT